MSASRPEVVTRPAASTPQVVVAALVLLVVATVGAVQAGLAGGGFMADLDQAQPALARIEPMIAPPRSPRLAHRVLLVIIDGLRFDRSYDLAFLDGLRRRGVDAEAQVPYPTWCRPNYVSILTGVPPAASGVRTDHHSTPVMLDSLMDRIRSAGLRAASASDFHPLPRLFLRRRSAPTSREPIAIDINDEAELDAFEDPEASSAALSPDADLESPFAEARYAPWRGGFGESADAVIGGDAEFVVLLVGAVDLAGHEHGADSVEYRDAVELVDQALANVLDRVDLTRDAIVITADHGHTGRGGHGGDEPELTSVPLIAAGAGIIRDATPRDAQLIDLAPTLAALLGIAAPGHGLGRTLTEVLDLTPADRARRTDADTLRLTAMRGAVEATSARAAIDVLEHRAARVILVVMCGGAAVLLAVALIRRRVLRLDVRILLVTVPAFFVVYYALIGILGQRFSPSLLPAQGHLAGELLRYGVVATTVQLLANLWALRSQPTLADRLAAANGIAWLGLWLAMVAAGVVWAFFPPPYVTIPSPFWLVAIPAVEVAVAGAAVTFALTLAVEVIVFLARTWHRQRPAATVVATSDRA